MFLITYEGKGAAYLLAKRIPLGPSAVVLLAERLGDHLGVQPHVHGDHGARLEAFHEPAADVVLTVLLDLLRRGTVDDEADGVL